MLKELRENVFETKIRYNFNEWQITQAEKWKLFFKKKQIELLHKQV